MSRRPVGEVVAGSLRYDPDVPRPGVGFVPVRKVGELPGETVSVC